ncbi:hypothetical protein [uncultured Acinetobacter sp.]|uniref:hypothetical protein n=1 Tax=uncultured Acinetobacter sp. TaxID=165433 RepID=UPI00261D85EA|nr:hypothetical protein [uncultured Acinetobacter sp.]
MKKLLIVGLLGFSLVGCGKGEPSPDELKAFKEVKAQGAVKQLLKDPDSAKFQNMDGMCGEVNSKNSFGAYTGYQRFVAAPDLAILETEVPKDTFNEVWSNLCN